MDLKELESNVDQDVHWYYQSKKLPLFDYAKKMIKKTGQKITVIDVGSGSGFFAIALKNRFPDDIAKVYLVDIGYSQEEMDATKGKDIEKVHRIPDNIQNGLVILMDVLEHLEDDLKMLQDIKAACTGDNNYFFITVPAFMSLWSGHDVYLGHYRRYKIPMLKDVLNKAHFFTTNSYYLYGGLFPMVYAVRKLDNLRKKEAQSNMKPFNSLTNSILKAFCSAEMKIASANKVFGITCVAEGKI